MTKNELIKTLADYFRLDYPEKDSNGNYNIRNNYDWQAGAYLSAGGEWLSLAEVVYALSSKCDD